MFRYDITESKVAAKAVGEISSRLWPSQQGKSKSQATLELVSMKESYDLELLTRFYNEIMIPNFPLEEERDDLEDWIYCLDPAKCHQNQNPYPSMDVLLLVKKESQSTKDEDNANSTTTIVAGVAFEYYRQAQCGLLSYMVVPKEFRRQGIMKSLHPVACHAMELLHKEHTGIASSSIRAIFAETNTPQAGDVPPEVIRKRHEILYQLGYRHLRFPYIQPALAEDAESFDDIILLIYAPEDSTSHDKAASETTIATEVLRDYVVDFFQSVTGYDTEKYKEDWFYQLVDWFAGENTRTDIAQGLPWEDITETMKETMSRSTSSALSENQNKQNTSAKKKENHVTVIGGGIAGLVATVTLAEEHLSHQNSSDGDVVPLTITLIEAQPFVGGRIRTVETRGTDTNESHPLIFNNDRLPPSRSVDGFAPWPVAIGGEFVHGVDSMANQLIEDHEEWLVHETFDLCESSEFYPARNSFVQRRSSITLSEEQRKTSHVEVFMDDNFCPLKENQRVGQSDSSQTNSIRKLIRRANSIWQNLQDISEELSESENEVKYGRDMSLDDFVEDQLSSVGEELTAEEVEKVKKVLESFYSNTAGSSNKYLGIHEASREEWSWEYTESNFRLEKCFNEFVEYYLDRIAEINQQSESSNLAIKINIEMSCPVSEIGSGDNKLTDDSPIRVLTRSGKTFRCNKCIVAVPLGVLKANKITFRDAYKIPREKQEAIDTINMFSGMKAHMLFRVGIDIQHISKRMKLTELLFCPGEIFSQIWLRRNEESVFLSGFCVANCRDKLMQIVANRGESKSDIAQELMLNQVQRIFGSLNPNQDKIFCNPSSPTCSSFALHDWSDDEFTLGIYSSPSMGAGWGGNKESLVGGDLPPTHRDILAKPINNEIWFSGEHANTTTCATVQSAMESGARAAKEVFLALEEA